MSNIPVVGKDSTSPTVRSIQKRIRAMRKKLDKIERLEIQMREGKSLNPDQIQTIENKGVCKLALVELEKLMSIVVEVEAENPVVSPEVAIPASPEVSTDGVMEILKLFYAARFINAKVPGGTQNRESLLAELGTQIRKEELDSLQFMTARIDGSSNPFALSEGLASSLEQSAEHARRFLAKSQDAVSPSMTYERISEIVNLLVNSSVFRGVPEAQVQSEVELTSTPFAIESLIPASPMIQQEPIGPKKKRESSVIDDAAENSWNAVNDSAEHGWNDVNDSVENAENAVNDSPGIETSEEPKKENVRKPRFKGKPRAKRDDDGFEEVKTKPRKGRGGFRNSGDREDSGAPNTSNSFGTRGRGRGGRGARGARGGRGGRGGFQRNEPQTAPETAMA